MTSNLISLDAARTDLPPLPSTVTTRSGVIFDPRQDKWWYRESGQKVSLSFDTLTAITSDMLNALKLTLIWYAESRSPSYLINSFNRFKFFLRAIGKISSTPLDRITKIHILNFKSTLTQSNEWYLRDVSLLIRTWQRLGYPGVEPGAVAMLDGIGAKPNRKGEAVRTFDPYDGPFTDIELESVEAALIGAYASAQITTDECVLAWLFVLIGARPVQFSHMKLCDFYTIRTDDGGIEYCLRVPRAKQKHGKPRLEFKEWLITPQIGKIVEIYVTEMRTKFIGMLDDPLNAPFFLLGASIGVQKEYEYHPTAATVGRRLIGVFKKLLAYSERTGALLHVTATRFRRTLGTRAVAEGHGEYVVAELLDHSDTSNVGVYVQATPAIVARIDKAIALQMAPLAQAFSGMLIKNEAEAARGSDPSSRIIDPRIDSSMRPMGSCGSHGFCSEIAPIACYTCSNFQPWLDGPHEAVLKHLIGERDRMLISTDNRIATVNDRTILAVAEVVRRCEASLSQNPISTSSPSISPSVGKAPNV